MEQSIRKRLQLPISSYPNEFPLGGEHGQVVGERLDQISSGLYDLYRGSRSDVLLPRICQGCACFFGAMRRRIGDHTNMVHNWSHEGKPGRLVVHLQIFVDPQGAGPWRNPGSVQRYGLRKTGTALTGCLDELPCLVRGNLSGGKSPCAR